MKHFLRIYLLIFLFSNKVSAQVNQECDNNNINVAISAARVYYGGLQYVELSKGSNNFFSANEYREYIQLKANKDYVFVFKTEKLVDQSSLSLLNAYNVIVQSQFKETGQERNLVVMTYKPNYTGTYTLVLKTVDYSNKSVCGAWIIFEK